MKIRILLLIVTLLMPTQATASVFINDVIGRFLPTIILKMDPGAYEKIKIFPGNDDNVGGILAMTFEEERDFFGFSILICDEENAALYEQRKSASCFRKEIDLKSDVLKYRFEASEVYYLFVVNRSKPLRTERLITITPYIYTNLNEPVRERLKAQLELMNQKLDYFFDLKPLNYAIIPCQQGFIPSSVKDRTVTVCSEFIMNPNAVPDKELMLAGIFYELTPFLQSKWKISEVDNMTDRLEYTSMLIMLFSKDKEPFTKFLDLLTEVHELYAILAKYPQHDKDWTREDYINALIDVNNDPFTRMDEWLHLTYEHMTSISLEKIRDGDYRHFGFLRDTARIVLKRRYEQELRANTPEEEEPGNIISDFW